MHSINRAAIVVKPKSAFFEWAKTLEEGLPHDSQTWTSVYLVSIDMLGEPGDILLRNFEQIFEEQLEAWHNDEEDWPAARPFALFQQWFQAEVVDLVLDLAEETLEYDD